MSASYQRSFERPAAPGSPISLPTPAVHGHATNGHSAGNGRSASADDYTAPLVSKPPHAPHSDAASSSQQPRLSGWALLSLCVPVIPSQLGWAVGEALLIPYLMSLGLEETTANAIWLINPIVGFFVQPYIGAWSDRYRGSWGRRRPFLFAFHAGIIGGLLMISFAPELHSLVFPSAEPFDAQSKANVSLLTVIFTGCVLMELSNDLLTIPSRALLNDNLPEAQVEQGNAWFSAVNSLGAVIGLTMCFLPLHEVWPLTALGTQLRATFVMCIGFVIATNLFTMTLDEWMEVEAEAGREEEGDEEERRGGEAEQAVAGEQQAQVEGEEDETAALLSETKGAPNGAYRAGASGGIGKALEGGELHQRESRHDRTEIVIDKHGAHSTTAGEHTKEDVEKEGVDPEHMSLLASLLAFRLLTPALLAIWVSQFTWWLVVMQCSFWWTTWVGIAVYGGDPLTSPDLFYEGVSYGIISTLVHSLVSCVASHFLIQANNRFGVTRVYHVSAVAYSIATAALWWWRSKEASMAYMVGTGFLYPVINTNPFILIEVHTADDVDDDTAGGDEQAGDDSYDDSDEDDSGGDAAAAAGASAHLLAKGGTRGRTAPLSLQLSLHGVSFHSDAYALSDGEVLTDRQRRTPFRSRANSVTHLSPSSDRHSGGAKTSLTHRRPHSSHSEVEEKTQPSQQQQQQAQHRAKGSPLLPTSPLRSLLYNTAVQRSPASSAASSKFSPTRLTLSPPTQAQLADESKVEPQVAHSADTARSVEGGSAATGGGAGGGGGAKGGVQLKASTHRGVLTALMNLSMGLSQIVSATLGGMLIDWWGDITVVFVVSGVLGVAVNAFVALYGLSSDRREASRDRERERRERRLDG